MRPVKSCIQSHLYDFNFDCNIPCQCSTLFSSSRQARSRFAIAMECHFRHCRTLKVLQRTYIGTLNHLQNSLLTSRPQEKRHGSHGQTPMVGSTSMRFNSVRLLVPQACISRSEWRLVSQFIASLSNQKAIWQKDAPSFCNWVGKIINGHRDVCTLHIQSFIQLIVSLDPTGSSFLSPE